MSAGCAGFSPDIDSARGNTRVIHLDNRKMKGLTLLTTSLCPSASILPSFKFVPRFRHCFFRRLSWDMPGLFIFLVTIDRLYLGIGRTLNRLGPQFLLDDLYYTTSASIFAFSETIWTITLSSVSCAITQRMRSLSSGEWHNNTLDNRYSSVCRSC
jgi:hypothetical protein